MPPIYGMRFYKSYQWPAGSDAVNTEWWHSLPSWTSGGHWASKLGFAILR